jgi:hypothetical protein
MTLEAFSLEGKVALVTGASRGLGAGMAAAMSAAGASVAPSSDSYMFALLAIVIVFALMQAKPSMAAFALTLSSCAVLAMSDAPDAFTIAVQAVVYALFLAYPAMLRERVRESILPLLAGWLASGGFHPTSSSTIGHCRKWPIDVRALSPTFMRFTA